MYMSECSTSQALTNTLRDLAVVTARYQRDLDKGKNKALCRKVAPELASIGTYLHRLARIVASEATAEAAEKAGDSM